MNEHVQIDPEHIEDVPGWHMSIAAAITCVSIVGISFGLGLPLLSLNIEEMTGSGAANGLNAFVAAVSTVIAAPFAPMVLSRFPTRPILVFALLFTSFSFIFYKAVPNVAFWIPMRFCTGMLVAVLFIASESWINQLAPERLRGRLLSFYSMSLASGFAGGSLLVAHLGVHGWAPFLAGAAICAAAALPLIVPGPELIPPTEESSSPMALLGYFKRAPAIMMAALAFGAIETSAMHFSAVWGVRSGLTEAQAAELISMGAIGVIVLQFPIGWLGDRFNRFRVLSLCALVALVAPIAMMLMASKPLALNVIAFFYLGFGEGIYILAMVLIGQRFKHAEITTASAALILMYGIGSTTSPMVVGPMMDLIDPNGAMYALAGFAGLYFLFTLFSKEGKKG